MTLFDRWNPTSWDRATNADKKTAMELARERSYPQVRGFVKRGREKEIERRVLTFVSFRLQIVRFLESVLGIKGPEWPPTSAAGELVRRC